MNEWIMRSLHTFDSEYFTSKLLLVKFTSYQVSLLNCTRVTVRVFNVPHVYFFKLLQQVSKLAENTHVVSHLLFLIKCLNIQLYISVDTNDAHYEKLHKSQNMSDTSNLSSIKHIQLLNKSSYAKRFKSIIICPLKSSRYIRVIIMCISCKVIFRLKRSTVRHHVTLCYHTM